MNGVTIIYSAHNPLTGKEEIVAVCDTAAIAAALPATYSPGSVAIVPDGGVVYMLDSTGWKVTKE